MHKQSELDERCINTIRFLSVDAVQKANSGHPGAPMGAAPMAYVLWDRFLKHNPQDPRWPDRDRFVLSAGHASMLLYSLLHLTGYDLSMDELRNFRQWGSRTPGHPEYDPGRGVEATTGPLGQGISHAVGIAMAEARLAARYNRPGHTVVDHFTYVIASDGDLMEGVSSEACSLAGHLRLGKLIVLYDDNRVSLAGGTPLSFTEDVGKRFEAFGWHVQQVADGNDLHALEAALRTARAESSSPSIIATRTILGYGAPHKQGTFRAHGSPLGPDEVAAAKQNLGWPAEPDFLVPEDALKHFRRALERGPVWQSEWQEAFDRYAEVSPALAAEYQRVLKGGLAEGWDTDLPQFAAEQAGPPTRKASEAVLQALAPKVTQLMAGSADLNPSCFTWLKDFGDFQWPAVLPKDTQGAVGGRWDYGGRNLHFGVREHAMGAIAGGMALHGGVIPCTGTFLVFSDYMRPPMRLAALMGIRVIYVFTHDSIGLGEDGPTHQPVEQVMGLRTVPNLTVIRPADANETVEAWRAALLNDDGPTALILTRQRLPVLDRNECAPAEGLQRGAYVLWQSDGGLPETILIGTGSEVHVALKAGRRLADEGTRVRVVSMPSWELFDQEDPPYRESVLPSSVRARVAVEAGVKAGWERYTGLDGSVVGLERFGASAPGPIVYEKLGFTAENVAAKVRELLEMER
jgi:transketolase